MDDVATGGFELLPGDVQYLLSKRAPLTPGEAKLLENFLVTRGSSLPPEMATMVGAKIGSAPTDWRSEAEALPTTTSPSVAEQVSQAIGAVPGVGGLAGTLGTLAGESGWGPDPVGAVLPNIPGLSDTGRAILSGQDIPATGPPTTGPGDDLAAEPLPTGGGPRVDPDTGTVTPPQDFISAQGGSSTLAPPDDPFSGGTTFSGANPLPDKGGGNDRARDRTGRGKTNWSAEREALGLSPDSAFADVGENFMIDYASSPDLAARAIAKRLGGGAQTAALIRPQVEAGLQLIASGGFGGRRGQLGPGQGTPAGQLALLEEYVRQGSGRGTSIDPRATVRGGLKRASRASAEELQAGAEISDDPMSGLAQQIQTTNAHLLAGAGQWGPGAADALAAKLDQASVEWMEAVATGTETRTYPQFLRDKGARRWIR